jgi:O-antigen/teichoic acid export membrane protein|tara:strand:- start:196 stop:1629 length:1434 start_codon:yes stop_codon:yes gene_type:complete
MIWRNLAKDSTIYGGADFVSKTLAILTFPLIAAVLLPSDFGSLELVLTVTTLLGMVVNSGLNNALQRFYWDPSTLSEERPSLVSSGLVALAINCAIAVAVGALFLLAFSPLLERQQFPISIVGLLAALILMAASQVGQYLLDVTRLHLAPWRFLMVSLVSRVLVSLAAVVAVVWLGWGLDGMLALQALVVLLAIPLAMLAVKRDIIISIDKNLMRQLLKFGHPFIYAGLAFWLFGAMDRWMLAAISSVEEVGLYSVAYRFSTVVLFVSAAFGQAWSPISMKVRSDYPGQYRSIYANVLLVLFSVMIILSGVVALFAGEVLSFLMPSNYIGAAMPLAVLSLGVALQATQQVTAVGISLEKKTHLFARLSWISVLVNLVLNLLLIPTLGALGAAWATTLTFLVLTSSYLYYTQILHTLPLDKRRMIGLCAVWLGLAIVATTMHSSVLSGGLIIAKLAILLAVTLACALFAPWSTIRYAK